MQELRTRLVEAEETARTAERQKNQLQRQLQDFRRRLTPLHLEMQRMVEKVGWLKGGHSFFWCRAALGSVCVERLGMLVLAMLVLCSLGS